MNEKERVDALAQLLEAQLSHFKQTRDIEFKVNVALWTAIVIAGSFVYQQNLRLHSLGEAVSYAGFALFVYGAHTFLWMVPIQYSEDTDDHFINQYRHGIEEICVFTPQTRSSTKFWSGYKRLRQSGWSWILGETWMTLVLLVSIGILLAAGPSPRAETPPNQALQPAAPNVR